MNYVIIRNNKALVKSVFDYIKYDEIKNPNEKQAELLKELCDKIEFIDSEEPTKKMLKQLGVNDWLYKRSIRNEFLELMGAGTFVKKAK